MSQKPAANHPQIAGKIPAQHPKSTAIPSFDDLADSAFIREAHMVQSHKRHRTSCPIELRPGVSETFASGSKLKAQREVQP
jgi:hypothetical protein